MLFFRTLVDIALAPFTLTIVALVAGALLRTRAGERTRRFGSLIFGAGFVALLCLSYGIPFDFIARALENRYSTIEKPETLNDVHWIVVLGGSTEVRPGLPVTAWPDESSIYRITEGVRLHRAIPNSKLIFSGTAGRDTVSTAAAGTAVAQALGVPADQIVTEERPRTTGEEAARIRDIVANERFVLVTAALHMTRAMVLFRHEGMNPIAAPTGFRSHVERRTWAEWITPSAHRIVVAGDTWHEILGVVAAKLGH